MSKANTAEGGTTGVTVTTGNSGGASGDAFNTVSIGTGGSISFSDTQKMHGNLSYYYSFGAGATLTDHDDTAASGSFRCRIYVFLESYPSATDCQGPLNARSTSANIGRLDISTSGAIRISSGATSSYTASGMSLNTWYRLEWYGTGWGTASTSSTIDIYVGENIGTPFTTVTHSGQTTAAQIQRMRIGKPGGSQTYAIYVDDIFFETGSAVPPGPAPGGFTVIQSEVLGISDSVSTLLSRQIVITDGLNLTDTGDSQQLAIGDSNSDNIGLTDNIALVWDRNVSVSDNLGLTDPTTIITGKTLSINDVAGISDATSITEVVAVSDIIGTTDTTVIDLGRFLTLVDTEGISDNVTSLISQTRTPSDTLGLTDGLIFDLSQVIGETEGITDNTTVLKSTLFSTTVTDSVGITDVTAEIVTDVVTDVLGLNDTTSLSREVVVFDNLSTSDNTSVQSSGSATATVNDAEGLTDTTAVVTASTRAQVDNFGLTDTLSLLLGANPTDNENITDLLALTFTVSNSDITNITDNVIIGGQPIALDILSITDIISVAYGTSQSDLEGISDNLVTSKNSDIAEALGLSDTILKVLSTVRDDLLSLSDDIGVSRILGLSDTLGLTDSRDPNLASPNLFVRIVNDTLLITDSVSTNVATIQLIPPYFTTTSAKIYVSASNPSMFYTT